MAWGDFRYGRFDYHVATTMQTVGNQLNKSEFIKIVSDTLLDIVNEELEKQIRQSK